MESLLRRLPSKWATAARCALGMSRPVTRFARIFKRDGNLVHGHLAVLSGHQGVQVAENMEVVQLKVLGSFKGQIGDWIGFSCPPSADGSFCISSPDEIWRISPGLIREKWSCVHLFAGSFGGWSRAFHWLNDEGIFPSSRAITIDNDPAVTHVWRQQGCDVLTLAHDFHTSSSAWCGLNAPITDHSWFGWLNDDDDIWLTLSPPCQSWSFGGTGSGLQADNGIAFLEGVEIAKKIRPALISCECSDAIIRHPDFAIVKRALWDIGYKIVWSDVMDCADYVKMKRNRWLATFARHDVNSRTVGTFKFTNMAKPSWDDCTFRFHVPEVVRNQLLLTPSLTEVYGCPRLLPVNMKGLLGDSTDQGDVLQCRVLAHESNMPTLCASYTNQHQLNSRHLSSKGIFASLKREGTGFSFFDPLMFVGMFGNPAMLSVVLPLNVTQAFHQLGNCISVQHALIPVCIGIVAASITDISIRQVVAKSFRERIQAGECHVFHNDSSFGFPVITKLLLTSCKHGKSHRDKLECFPQMAHSLQMAPSFPSISMRHSCRFSHR
eukprot:Skav223871  [mRNA]  locus=scaffold1226:250257:251906:- [translate_table: standard]